MMTDNELLELYRTEKNMENRKILLEKLLKNMEKYIQSVLSKNYIYLLSEEYYQDVMQDCRLAVLEQLQSYNFTEEASFLTYCRLPIQQKIHYFITKNIYKNSSYNQKKYGKVEFTNFDNLELFLSQKHSFENDSISKIDILNLLDTLDCINKFILVQFYVNQMSIKDISAELGLSEISVKKRKVESLKKLRMMIS